MIKQTRTAILTALSLFIAINCFGISASFATPIQEKDDLEKLILEKIEQRKKELEAEKSANKKSSSKSSSTSKPTASLSTREATTPSKTINSARTPDPATEEVTVPSRVRQTPREAVYTKPTKMSSADKNYDPSIEVQFSFADEEWKDVIEWFAEQVGFGVYYGQTGPPQGTFTYFDTTKRNVLEALNFINSRLAVLDPPHVLVRNGNQLVLVNESLNYPIHLIARVTEEELDDYGTFEVVSCLFDLDKLNGNVISVQLRENISEVHLDGFSYIEAANRLRVRERVYELRRIRDLINFAKQAENKIVVDTYECNHVEPESLLINLRPLMGFAPDINVLDDGSLSFSVQALGTKIYLKGTPERIDEFKETALLIDTEFDGGDELLEKPFLKIHPVSGDPAVIFQVIQTLLEGEQNVKLDQDSVNGNLYVWGIKSIHQRVTDALDTMSGDASFTIIPVKNISPSDAVSTIEDLLGIDTFSTEETSGPKLVADSDNDRVMVNGTPREIQLVTKMIQEIDQDIETASGPRRSTRFIQASPRQAETIMNYFQIPGIMDSIGRSNRLQLIMPKDRKNFRGGMFNQNFPRREEPNEEPNSDSPSSRPAGTTTTTLTVPVRSAHYAVFQDEGGIASETTQQPGTNESSEIGYRPAEEKPSVPGAPVEIRMTDQGLVIVSEDLDAADDIEILIKDLIDTDGTNDLPAFFYLENRKVDEVKTILDSILGLSSSSGGGGGGGLGNFLGGAVSNAIGGPAGDALGGLLGGGGDSFGGDSSGSGIELQGEDVKLSTDVRSNLLIVTGATSMDLDLINELLEIFDIDSPPQDPNLSGNTYEIVINYRDAMDVKDMVVAQYADYFASTNNSANANQNRGNVEQQIQRQVLQQLTGANRRGRGGNSAASQGEQPKARIGVDEQRNALLITGPKFIYIKVNDFVQLIDRQNKDKTVVYKKLPPNSVINLLKIAFGDNVVTQEEMEESGGISTGGTAGNSSRRGSTNSRSNNQNRGGGANINRDAIQRSILNQIRNGGGQGGGQNRGLGGRAAGGRPGR